MKGYIHSIQSMGTLDGPGVRAVVFMQGCPLRCIYCHNPDTWEFGINEEIDSDTLCQKLSRLYPYIKNGGVTFSGGEPCMQAEFLCEAAYKLREKGLHIALDTSGEIWNRSVERLLSLTDLVLLDIKMTSEEDYGKYIGGRLEKVLFFLEKCEEMHKNVWIRHVVVPNINDNAEDIKKLGEIIKKYSCVKKTELLPFKTLCIEKYKQLAIPFALENTPQMDIQRLVELQSLI